MLRTRLNPLGRKLRSFTRWEITHGAGLLDISIIGAPDLLWTFPDSSTSTLPRPQKTVGAGTTVITSSNFAATGVQLFCYPSTALASTPINLADIPNFTEYINWQPGSESFYGTAAAFPRVSTSLYIGANITIYGSIRDLPRVNYSILINSTNNNIVGTASEIPRVSYRVYLNNIPGLTGSVAALWTNVTGELRVTNCGITGALPIHASNTVISYYANPNVSPTDYDQTIANCVAAGTSGPGRALYISSRRTSASDADIATLLSRGWGVSDSNV